MLASFWNQLLSCELAAGCNKSQRYSPPFSAVFSVLLRSRFTGGPHSGTRVCQSFLAAAPCQSLAQTPRPCTGQARQSLPWDHRRCWKWQVGPPWRWRLSPCKLGSCTEMDKGFQRERERARVSETGSIEKQYSIHLKFFTPVTFAVSYRGWGMEHRHSDRASWWVIQWIGSLTIDDSAHEQLVSSVVYSLPHCEGDSARSSFPDSELIVSWNLGSIMDLTCTLDSGSAAACNCASLGLAGRHARNIAHVWHQLVTVTYRSDGLSLTPWFLDLWLLPKGTLIALFC